MLGNSVHAVELVFLLLLLVRRRLRRSRRKIQIPLPHSPRHRRTRPRLRPRHPAHLSISPDVIFLVVLPALALYRRMVHQLWRDFKYNIVSILFLAFGLVGFTVWGVAEAANYSFAPFDLRLGCSSGAVSSPPPTPSPPPRSPKISACHNASSTSSKAKASSTTPPASSPSNSASPWSFAIENSDSLVWCNSPHLALFGRRRPRHRPAHCTSHRNASETLPRRWRHRSHPQHHDSLRRIPRR